MSIIEKINKVLPKNHSYIKAGSKRLKELESNNYQLQAIDFLIDAETTCDIQKLGQRTPPWRDDETLVNFYRVTLENSKGKYSFDFYDSIKNTEVNKSLTLDFYSVLAAIGYYCPESFDDFASELGYEFKTEKEYIKIKQTHLNCLDEIKGLQKIFTSEQIEKLSEIR